MKKDDSKIDPKPDQGKTQPARSGSIPDVPGGNPIQQDPPDRLSAENLSSTDKLLGDTPHPTQTRLRGLREHSNECIPGPERIQIAFGKFPLRARWERHACKEDFL